MINASNAVPQPPPSCKNFRDLTGQRFGKLVAKFYTGRLISKSGYSASMWLCTCDCGKNVVCRIGSLNGKHTRSCGCIAMSMRMTPRKHGNCTGGKISPELSTWYGIKQRCFDSGCKNFTYYGGRGITMSAEWAESFEVFLSDMGVEAIKTSLHRTS